MIYKMCGKELTGRRNKVTLAQHSTAQHSTAQHSTAQHSTAQHSTAKVNWAFSSYPKTIKYVNRRTVGGIFLPR